MQGPITLCIDIGGSKTKLVRCDARALPLDEPLRKDTPARSHPESTIDLIAEAVDELGGEFDRVSVGYPGVIRNGVCETAVNLDPSWQGFPISDVLTARLGRDTRAANDADVQGLGCIRGHGTELVLTLGTGIGSALFRDGVLIPNCEFGHLPYGRESTFEHELGKNALHALGWEAWLERIPPALDVFRRCFNPDLILIGGGNARFLPRIPLPDDIVIVPNEAGLYGGVRLWLGVQSET
ncbi:MAG: ROK family protein [Planctomycetes bacterium]|nr:ROK family protein [Planctomycetota bacterium]MCB9919547.1 ROK family protein [Planctomycetota bacterium]